MPNLYPQISYSIYYKYFTYYGVFFLRDPSNMYCVLLRLILELAVLTEFFNSCDCNIQWIYILQSASNIVRMLNILYIFAHIWNIHTFISLFYISLREVIYARKNSERAEMGMPCCLPSTRLGELDSLIDLSGVYAALAAFQSSK